MGGMSEWIIALIAAGSALAGSLLTGWFTGLAGTRQAEAARHAGDRQADAVLETVRMTVREQREARLLDLRRRAYLDFLAAAEAMAVTRRTGAGPADGRLALERACAAVQLEGPDGVARAARELTGGLLGSRSPDEIDRAREVYLDAAREALGS